MRIAYFDCFSGISGDMTLGSLIDAGASADAIESGVRSLGLGELTIRTEEVRKCGFRALQVHIDHPPEHAHRHLHHIEAMIDQADAVAEQAKQLAKRIFGRLGEAEAKVHGTTIQKVHFHEVGAVDSIADIVGTAIALTELGIEAVEASPVPTGTGMIEIAHGRVSVPAPATAELLRDVPLASSDVPMELTTPTGAAILSATARRFGAVSAMTPSRIGYGAGSRDIPGQANVLRVLIGEMESTGDEALVQYDRVTVLETNIDNTTAEDLSACVERLFDAGALDVYQTPCLMKKGRSGVQLTALCAQPRVAAIEALLFQHTGTIGIRRWQAERHKLARREAVVETPLGPVRGKEVRLPDGTWRFAVEYDDARAIAMARGVQLADVRQQAAAAYRPTAP